jgi:heme-degrading monooxygenase HmoA
MSASSFAKLPQPPYYAVILLAQRTEGDHGYAETAAHLIELIAQQPGFLGSESINDASGFGITVAYFDSEDAIRQWRDQADHTIAREKGRSTWYSQYAVRVAKVERAYDVTAPGIE